MLVFGSRARYSTQFVQPGYGEKISRKKQGWKIEPFIGSKRGKREIKEKGERRGKKEVQRGEKGEKEKRQRIMRKEERIKRESSKEKNTGKKISITF